MNQITQAAVLCGGLGTRLRPLTFEKPKPLLEVGGKPMLELVLSKLVKNGITEAILLTGYKSDMIEDYFGDGRGYGLRIKYSIEDKPLGSAGALLQTVDSLAVNFLVCNCDTILDYPVCDLAKKHIESKALATLLLAKVDEIERFGIAELDGDGAVTRFLEKPKPDETKSKLASMQVFVLNKGTFEYSKKDSFSMEREVFPQMCHARKVFGLEKPARIPWVDVGTLSDLETVNAAVEQGEHAWLFK